MRLVRSKDTKTEWTLRRLIYALGYRYRLHDRRLPGSPDVVFRRKKKVVFVHGCFWHGHDCKLGRMPKSRVDFWSAKIASNRERDARVLKEIRAMRWRALVVWECQLERVDWLKGRIGGFLDA
jgi:DNA mismatch endonuclease (patch repair protein)